MRIFTALVLAACTCTSAQAQQETLEGMLERGPAHSVLWAVSPESGDLIGQVFANTSPAGQTILAHCLPGLHCVAEGASTTEPPDGLTEQLPFSAQPSGWWLITQSRSAYMQPSLPMNARQLSTRHGQIAISDEHVLLFNGRPVTASPPDAAKAAAPAPSSTPRTVLDRISAWWQGFWAAMRGKLLALLGGTPATQSEQPAAIAQAELVQGNSALQVVAHFELDGGQDIVLLQDTGGTACPALYRFATLTPQGIAVTQTFGTCSDLAAVTFDETPSGMPEPLLTMTGFLGPFEPEEAQQRTRMQLHRFALRQGQVQELQAQRL